MNQYYKSLLQLFLAISLFKKSPASIEKSCYLLRLSFSAYVISGGALLSIDKVLSTALFQALFEVGLLSLFVYLLLAFFGKSSRYSQTIIAMYGCGAMISSLSIPTIIILKSVATETPLALLMSLFLLALVGWSFAIVAYIIVKAIDKSLSVSVLLAFCYFYLSYKVVYSVFPVALS